MEFGGLLWGLKISVVWRSGGYERGFRWPPWLLFRVGLEFLHFHGGVIIDLGDSGSMHPEDRET